MQTVTRDLKIQSMNHQPTSQSLGRVMTVSNVSSSIPPTSNNRPSYTMPSRQTGKSILAFGGEKQGNESDTSSICRSPGWEDSKKRKKAKQDAKDMRRWEKQKADIETREMRQPGRLTKAPPASRGISKLSASMIRSDSAPVLHTSAVPATGNNKVQPSSETTSNDAGSRKFIPWKSANTMTVLEAEVPENRGFIGGLKLQQATQVTAQQSFRKTMSPAVKIHRSNFVEEFSVGEDGLRKSFNKLQGGGLDLIEPKDKAPDEKSISSRVSRKLEDSEEPSEVYIPTIERSIRRARKGRSSGSEPCIQQAHISKHITPRSEASQDVALSRTQIGQSSPRKSSKPSPVQSSEGPPISYREPPQLEEAEPRPRRSSFSFLRAERQQSKSTSTTSYQEGSRLSKATSRTSIDQYSRGRSWSFTKSSRTSISRPTTAHSFKSKGSMSNDAYQTFFDSDDLPAPSEIAGSSNESLPPGERDSRTIHLQGFMAAAKAALSRATRSPLSLLDPSKSFTAEKVRQTALSPASPNQILHSVSPSPRIAEKVVPQEAAASAAYTPDDTLNEKTDQSSNLSSLSGSSDEYHSINDPVTWSMSVAPEPQLIASNAGAGEDTKAKSKPTTDSTAQLPTDQVMDAAIQYENSNSKASGSSSNSTSFPSSCYAQDLSFLPPLRHRTLRRPTRGKEMSSAIYSQTVRRNPTAPFQGPLLSPPPRSSSFFTSALTPPDSTKTQSARYLHDQSKNILPSASTSRVSLDGANKQDSNTRAKMFVVCCNCHYFHDMPSKIYECMVKPDNVVTDADLGVSGVISTRVKCPWCAHGMSSTCCEGWATVVIMKERLH
jgi:hypothetical protein